ncbi:hypothetical protein V2J09_015848 [Rumex salicifolius]
MAAFCISFSPQALCRPTNTRNPRTSPRKKTSRIPAPNPRVKPQKPLHRSSSSLIGIEATTYTRLPPRDDASLSSIDPLFQEIKLSDSNVAVFEKKADEFDGLESDGEGADEEVGFDKDRFEVFDGELDSDNDDDDEFDAHDEGATQFMGIRGEEFQYEGVEFEEEDNEEKEKGVPAIMRCFDQAKIYVKAGDGGNGVVAFRREKFVPFGGPSGGDGGRGGNVYVEVDQSMNSLLPFRKNIHFRALSGKNGQGSNQHGANGEDLVVKVAPGTVIREARSDGSEGEVLLELLHPGQKALLLKGGRGGRGNASFKSGNNRVPKIAENGEEGPEMWMQLELKLVADVGIVGAPNAGKSTLLSVISLAQPKIANYPFTTLLPNLGVVAFGFDATMVVADLPGLLEGAHRGFGLGHEFLRHTERCSVLVHVVDGSLEQPEYEFDAVRLELELFNPELSEKPFIVAYNKMDLPEASNKWESFKEYLQSKGVQPFCMSAVTKEGTNDVVCAAYELVKQVKEAEKNIIGRSDPVNLNYVAEMVSERRKASISEFEITHESSTKTWVVDGPGLERFIQMTNWRYVDSERRFQHVLDASGVNKSLIKRGVKEGDLVVIGGLDKEDVLEGEFLDPETASILRSEEEDDGARVAIDDPTGYGATGISDRDDADGL